MFEKLQAQWNEEDRRETRYLVYRAWIGTGLALLACLIILLERSTR
jgi:hypothetical protein